MMPAASVPLNGSSEDPAVAAGLLSSGLQREGSEAHQVMG
jgi:hypothetical protein